MNSYYQIPEDRRDEFMNLQIDSWRAQIALLNAIKPIVKAYDGKTYSKRFDKAIEEKYNTREDRDNYAYVTHSYGDRLYICAVCKRELIIPKEHYNDHHQISDKECDAYLATYTPEGATLRRIDAAETIKHIDADIEKIHEEINQSLKAYANLTQYREKIKEANRILQEASELVKGAPSEFTHLYKTEYCLKESRY